MAAHQLITAWAFFMSIQNTVEQVKKHEGFRRHPYYCTANKLTIGYGRNLDDMGITQEEADMLLENDLKARKSAIKREIDTRYCNSARFAVLLNMAYNLGIEGLLAFKKSLAFVEAGSFEEAANEMLDSYWARQVPNRARELATQMRTGEW